MFIKKNMYIHIFQVVLDGAVLSLCQESMNNAIFTIPSSEQVWPGRIKDTTGYNLSHETGMTEKLCRLGNGMDIEYFSTRKDSHQTMISFIPLVLSFGMNVSPFLRFFQEITRKRNKWREKKYIYFSFVSCVIENITTFRCVLFFFIIKNSTIDSTSWGPILI